MDRKQVTKIADKEAMKVVKGHEKRMHKMAKGGVAGVSGEAMKAVGRNMARVNNQGGR
jgi:hypothetical protein